MLGSNIDIHNFTDAKRLMVAQIFDDASSGARYRDYVTRLLQFVFGELKSAFIGVLRHPLQYLNASGRNLSDFNRSECRVNSR